MKPRPTPQRFQELAAEMRDMHTRLCYIAGELMRSYPKSQARSFYNACEAVRNKLITARLRLEDLACDTYGDNEGMRIVNTTVQVAE